MLMHTFYGLLPWILLIAHTLPWLQQHATAFFQERFTSQKTVQIRFSWAASHSPQKSVLGTTSHPSWLCFSTVSQKYRPSQVSHCWQYQFISRYVMFYASPQIELTPPTRQLVYSPLHNNHQQGKHMKPPNLIFSNCCLQRLRFGRQFREKYNLLASAQISSTMTMIGQDYCDS